MRRRTAAPLARFRRSRRLLAAEPANVAVSETVDQVIVDHADRLHVRVDHCRSDEAEPAALEIAAECVRLGGRCGNLTQRLPAILAWSTIDKLPAIRVEASEFFLHDEKRLRVPHCRRDLH